MVSSGRVLIIPKGAWDNATTYNMLDAVFYSGNLYIAKRQNVNVTPVEGDDWMLSAEGATGALVASFNSRTGNVVPANGDYSLPMLSDINLSSLANGQALVYDSTSQKWVNATISNSLETLTDTDISSPTEGQAIVYDSQTAKWKNATPSNSLEGLSDTNITLPSNAQILKFDSASSKWINGQDNLANQSDVNITTPSDGDVLVYDGTSQKWKNGNTSADHCMLSNGVTSVEDAFDELKWTFLGQYTDTNQHDLPSDFTELLIETEDTNNFYYSTYILKDMLLPTDRPFYLSSSGVFRVSTTYIKKVYGASIRVYYK